MLQSSTAINTVVVARSLRASTLEDKQVQWDNVHQISHHLLFICKTLFRFDCSRRTNWPLCYWSQVKHTYSQFAGSSLGKMDWKADAIIDIQTLITCCWPYIDLAVSANLTNTLITICYWFLNLLHNIHVYTLPSHINKLRGLDPAPLWLVLNPSKCWGKTKPAAVTDMKHQRMMSLQKCAIFVLSISIACKRTLLLDLTSKYICKITRHVMFASGHHVHSDSAQTSMEEMSEHAHFVKNANRVAPKRDWSINN